MKNLYHLVAILVILALVAIPLTGCVKITYETPASQQTSAPSSQQASLSEATICKSVNLTTMAPIERADVFPPDFNIIYCSVKLSNAPPNTEVKAQWFDNNNQQLLEKTITADGTRYIASSITRATAAPFTTGNYAVKLFLNGKEQVTVPFKLQASTAVTVQPAGISLPNIFQEPGFGYTIKYPSDWVYEKSNDYTVVFSGKPGTDAYYSTVTIQTLASVKSGGKYSGVDDVVNDFRNQLNSAQNVTVTDTEKFEFTAEGVQTVTGKMFCAAYTLRGENSKQLQIVVPRADGKAFYAFAYTSPVAQYETYTPIYRAMLDSWTIIK
jgi:hypothetical protein